MSDTNQVEKKWFIYVKDHHEGPFSVLEIHEGIRSGKFIEPAYVWHQQLPDWMPTTELPDFQIPKPPTHIPPPLKKPPLNEEHSHENLPEEKPFDLSPDDHSEVSQEDFSAPQKDSSMIEIRPLNQKNSKNKNAPSPLSVEENPKGREIIQPEYLSHQAPTEREEISDSFEYTKNGTPVLAKKKFLTEKQKKIVLVILLFGLVGSLISTQPALRTSLEPLLSIFSPFPKISDVSPVDGDALKKAAKTSLNNGIMVEVAVSTADPISPSFYLSTNLGSGAKFEIVVIGVPESLLNVLRFEGHLNVSTENGLGKTQALRFSDGKVIPRGEYKIYVVEAATGQPPEVNQQLSQIVNSPKVLPNGVPNGRKIFFEKKVFWGERDQTYLSRLKEFHDKLIEKSSTEVAEIGQMNALMESQIQKTNADFDRLKTQSYSPKLLQAWNHSSQTWNQFANQITQSLSKTTTSDDSEWVHGNLFQHLKRMNLDLIRLRQLQESFFTQKIPLQKINEEESALRKSLDQNGLELKSALTVLAQAPTNAVGLPNTVVVKYEELKLKEEAPAPVEASSENLKAPTTAPVPAPVPSVMPAPAPSAKPSPAPLSNNNVIKNPSSQIKPSGTKKAPDDLSDDEDEEDMPKALPAKRPQTPSVKGNPPSQSVQSFGLPHTIVVKPSQATKIPTQTTVNVHPSVPTSTPKPTPSPIAPKAIKSDDDGLAL